MPASSIWCYLSCDTIHQCHFIRSQRLLLNHLNLNPDQTIHLYSFIFIFYCNNGSGCLIRNLSMILKIVIFSISRMPSYIFNYNIVSKCKFTHFRIELINCLNEFVFVLIKHFLFRNGSLLGTNLCFLNPIGVRSV